MRRRSLTLALMASVVVAGFIVPDRYWYDFRLWLVAVTCPAIIVGVSFKWRSRKYLGEDKEMRLAMGRYWLAVAFFSVLVGVVVSVAGVVKAFPD